jgi:Polysaccharide biosynthesis enzyme WcbI
MKIGVFGNCQSHGMARSIMALLPGVEVHLYTLHEARIADEDTICRQMDIYSACDIVLYQPSMRYSISGLQSKDFEDRCKRTIQYPFIACRSFHPDCHFLLDAGGNTIIGKIGPYHSAIIVAAYKAGLSVERATLLFNMFTYRAMGYLDYSLESEPVAVEANLYGFDYHDFFTGNHGNFMLTINHPKINIIYSTAKQCLEKLDIKASDHAAIPPDNLEMKAIWPIYPGLHQSLSHQDNPFLFQQPRSNTSLSLPEFITGSYALYDTVADGFHSELSDKASSFISEYVV